MQHSPNELLKHDVDRSSSAYCAPAPRPAPRRRVSLENGVPTDGAADLRRRHRREVIDTLVARAEFLPPDERGLLDAVYREGRPVAHIAEQLALPPRTLRRRVRRIVTRVLEPRYGFVARTREAWPATRRRVATLHVLHGRSMRSIAAQLGLSLHTVRRHADAVETLFQTELAAGKERRAAGSAA